MAKQGLMNTTALAPAAAATAAAPPSLPPTAAAPEPPANVTDDEQREYDQLVNNAYKLLYTDMETLLESIAGNGDPVMGLADTVSQTFSRLIDSSRQSGVKFEDGVVLHAGIEVLEDLADLAADSGIHDFTPEELESATYLAAEKFRDLQQDSGYIDPNTAANDLAQIAEAEQAGQVDQVLPGLAGRFEGASGAVPTVPASPAPRRGLAG